MMAIPNNDLALLRAEIAARAARMIAEDGADYGTAKRKAMRQVLGDDQAPPNLLPDNAEIEEEVRKYQALFLADTQPARLRALARHWRSQVMEQLEQFRPYLTGAVLNGTAGEHDDVHLQLFADSAKDVIMFLLDRDVQYRHLRNAAFQGRPPRPGGNGELPLAQAAGACRAVRNERPARRPQAARRRPPPARRHRRGARHAGRRRLTHTEPA